MGCLSARVEERLPRYRRKGPRRPGASLDALAKLFARTPGAERLRALSDVAKALARFDGGPVDLGGGRAAVVRALCGVRPAARVDEAELPSFARPPK